MYDTKSKRPLWLWVIPLALIAIVGVIFASTMAQATLDDSDAMQSEEYTADMNLAQLSVALVENDGEGGNLVVTSDESGNLSTTDDNKLLSNLGPITSYGKYYDETLSARNDGEYEEYVRVVVNKYWKGSNDKKNTNLDPELIMLKFDEANWTVVDDPTDKEQVILYSKSPLAPGKQLAFLTGIAVSPDTLSSENQSRIDLDNGYYTFSNMYGSYDLGLDVEVSAVQASSAEEAMTSAWGVSTIGA